MKKLLLILTLLLSTLNPIALASEGTEVVATYYVVNCREWITLRDLPWTQGDELARIPLGQAVGFIEVAENGFYKINYDGLVGYALGRYLSPNETVSDRFAKVVNCREAISLREYPSVESVRLKLIPLGSYVKFLGKASNGFYRIEFEGVEGYALQAYLELQ